MECEQGVPVRILLAGACRGNFNKLLKRVEKVHSRNGPFDVLFCIGNFFPETREAKPDEFMEFLNSEKRMPMSTYILGAWGNGSDEAIAKMNEVDCNIHYLGKSGLLEMHNGLSIAFLEGFYDKEHYEKEMGGDRQHYTWREVEIVKKAALAREGDVDFFLTTEWPEGITKNVPADSLQAYSVAEFPKGSPVISSILSVIRPRYHFTSQQSVYYSRIPYENPDLGAGSHVTRFMSLGSFGSAAKQNLLALCLTPAKHMDREKFCEIPSDTTDCPFDWADSGKRYPSSKVGDQRAVESSCTPLSPSFSQSQFAVPQPNLWINASPVQSPLAQSIWSPSHSYSVLSNPQASPQGNGLGVGVQTLLQNIGRGNAISNIPNVDTQEGFAATDLLQPHQMDLSQQQPQDLQALIDNLTQNPQLLNAALSMGFFQNQSYLSQDQFVFKPPLANFPEWNCQQASDFAFTNTARPRFPAPQSKRFKRGIHPVVKDRRKTCFVTGVQASSTREDIADFFSSAGEVVDVAVGRNERKADTWCFVQFSTREERNYAVKTLDGAFFMDHRLAVSPARDELDFDPNEPVSECWFCLGSPSSDKNLVVSVGSESYLAVDKGPIRDDHVLIIPTSHYPNTLKMSQRYLSRLNNRAEGGRSCYQEMQMFLLGLKDLFASQDRYLLAFERYLQLPRLHGNHTHLSVISIDQAAAYQAKDIFIQAGQISEGEWSWLSETEGSREAIHDLVGDEEYICIYLPDGSKLVRVMLKNQRLPVSFARDVIAELAGVPERADWKTCLTTDADLKTKVEKFKSQFSQFDYPNTQ